MPRDRLRVAVLGWDTAMVDAISGALEAAGYHALRWPLWLRTRPDALAAALVTAHLHAAVYDVVGVPAEHQATFAAVYEASLSQDFALVITNTERQGRVLHDYARQQDADDAAFQSRNPAVADVVSAVRRVMDHRHLQAGGPELGGRG